MIALLVGLLIFMIYAWFIGMSSKIKKANTFGYINVTQTEQTISRALLNGATTDDMKNILLKLADQPTDNRNNKEYYIQYYKLLINDDNNRKIEFTPLDKVLGEIRSYYVSNDSTISNRIIDNLKNLISEFNETDPFAKLEKNQRYFFENLRVKLDTNYIKIESDVNEIVNELESKNLLVNEYLANANSAYRNSRMAMMIAGFSLFATLIFQIIGIYRRKTSS